MERIIVFVSVTLFVVWFVVDIIYFGVPDLDLYRNGLLPHRRMFNVIGIALLLCAGAGGLIWLVRSIVSRLRGRT